MVVHHFSRAIMSAAQWDLILRPASGESNSLPFLQHNKPKRRGREDYSNTAEERQTEICGKMKDALCKTHTFYTTPGKKKEIREWAEGKQIKEKEIWMWIIWIKNLGGRGVHVQ